MEKGMFRGVLPAMVLPFKENFEIDEAEARKVLRYVLSADIGGIVVNAHAGEVMALSRQEKVQVIKMTLDEVRGRVPVVTGVYSENTREAIELAEEAKSVGVQGILLFPPWGFIWGAADNPEVVYQFYKAVNDAVNVPIIVFCYGSAYGFTPEVMARLAELERVVATKMGGPVPEYQDRYVAIKGKISVLCSADRILFYDYFVGAEGSLVGLASLCPHWIVELFQAVKQCDMKKSKEIDDHLYPITRLVYTPPTMDMHTRIKEMLVMLGVIRRAVPRPPLLPITEQEIAKLRQALEQSGLVEFFRQKVLTAATSGLK